MKANDDPRKAGTLNRVTRWNSSVPRPANSSVAETESPVMAGTRTVAPNMANMCWSPSASILGLPRVRASRTATSRDEEFAIMNRVLKYLSGVRRNGKRRPSLDRKNRRSDAASYGNGRSSSQRYSVSAYNPNIRAAKCSSQNCAGRSLPPAEARCCSPMLTSRSPQAAARTKKIRPRDPTERFVTCSTRRIRTCRPRRHRSCEC